LPGQGAPDSWTGWPAGRLHQHVAQIEPGGELYKLAMDSQKKCPKRTWAWFVWIASFIREFDWLKSWVSRSISMKFHSAFGIAELKNLPFFKVILSSCPWENLQLLITTPGRKPTQSILSRIRKLPVASIVGVWNHGVHSVTSLDVGQENWWARDFQWGVDILQPIFFN
jgi:hypothetical protein